MKIADLFIMQETLTEVEQFRSMVEFVRGGGFFTKSVLESHEDKVSSRVVLKELQYYPKTRLISITEFEDGVFYIHDGHHRAGSVLAGGRDYLRGDEYKITKMRYTQYDEINPGASFVTPFVPPHEVRLADFSEFKNTAIGMIQESRINDAVFYIRTNRHLYCKPRKLFYVEDLIKGMPC